MEGDHALVQAPGAPPCSVNIDALHARWDGTLLLLRPAAGPDTGTLGGWGRWMGAFLRHRRELGHVVAASLFLQVFALVTPLFFQVVIDKVLVHGVLATLDVLVLGLVGIALFEALLGLVRGYLYAHTAARVDVELTSEVFGHLLRVPLRYFATRAAGHTVARVRELERIREFLGGSFLTLAVDSLFAGVFIGVMYLYSPSLTAVACAALPLYAALPFVFGPALRRRVEARFASHARLHANLVETVGAIDTVKALGLEDRIRERFDEELARYACEGRRTSVLGGTASHAARLISRVTGAFILWFGARQVVAGALSVGELVAFNMLAGQLSSPALRLAHLWQDFQQARVSSRRLRDLTETPAEIRPPNPATPRRATGAIRFESVRFRYHPQDQLVLHGLSLEVPAGQVIGVVGRSGSGKSTLARLLQRLYVPEGGRILLDGVDIAQLDPAWLRTQVAVVPQECSLFQGSVRENIAITDPTASDARVEAAARLAGAHGFVVDLPQGYDTPVGERGGLLSGGQRQRLAIARALLYDPPVLVFDEATSALDLESERELSRNMPEICAGRTVLVIAHRQSAVRFAGRVIGLEEGRVAEDGAHAELANGDGVYARLFAAQGG